MPSWIQDRETGKLVPRDEYVPRGTQHHTVLKALEPFVSPIDGTVISDRSHLRAHNKRHGVTQTLDYGPDYFQRRSKEMKNELSGNTKQARQERVNALNAAYDKLR